MRSGRAIFLRCLQNLRFVWLRLGFGFCAVRHRALVVLCLFPSFAFLFSLVYAATAPTRDGGRSSASFLKKQARLRRPFFSKRVDISPHFCYTNYRRVLYGGFSCHTTFPIVRARACGLMFSWECSELLQAIIKGLDKFVKTLFLLFGLRRPLSIWKSLGKRCPEGSAQSLCAAEIFHKTFHKLFHKFGRIALICAPFRGELPPFTA